MESPFTGSVLLTNDDGVDAPGMDALVGAMARLAIACQVVAPFGPYSGCSHAVTTHKPLTIVRRQDGRTVVEGTPADCVRLAIHHLVPELTWVVSGINAGGNLGADVFHSGTVAAVREAVLQGRSGIAVSHYIARGREIDWDRATRWTARVVAELMARPREAGVFWNVNLPHPGPEEPELVFCPLDSSPLPLKYRLENEGAVAHYEGDYQARARVAGSDVAVCFGGQIAITALRLV